MKEDKNVPDSVTSDVKDIASNLKELDKNTQKKDAKPDVYAEKLPVIIEELRMHNKQLVEEKDWYKYTALTCTPVAGAVYMLLQGDEKNLNKRNYCLAAFKTNIAYTAALILMCVAVFFAGNALGRAGAAKATVNVSSNSESTSDNSQEQSQEATSSENMDKDTTNYVYNAASKTLDITLDGVNMTYPVTAQQLKSNGYTYMAQASQPYSQALMTSYVNSTGTKVALTITLSDTPQDEVKCSQMQINFSDKTQFLGLNNKSDIETVRSVFASADKEDVTDFNESTKTGSIIYGMQTINVTVSMKNGIVSSVTIS